MNQHVSMVAEIVRVEVAKYLPASLGPDDSSNHVPFTQLGLDSVGFITVMVALEEAFDITVDDDDLLPQNFQDIASIVAYVERKRQP